MRISIKGVKRISAMVGRSKTLVLDMLILLRTNSFNQNFYEKNATRKFRCRCFAIIHYLTVGNIEGAEPSPLFSGVWLAVYGHSIRNLGHYLRCANAIGNPWPHPLFDTGLVQMKMTAFGSEYGVLEAFVTHATAATVLPRTKYSMMSVDLTYGDVLSGRETTENHENSNVDAIGVIVDDISSVSRALEVIKSIYADGSGNDLELVLIPSSSREGLYQLLSFLELVNPNITILRRQSSVSRGRALNAAFKMCRAPHVIFAHAGHRMTGSNIKQMREAVQAPGVAVVQPLVLDRTGLIASAGVVFPNEIPVPVPWLRGISPETADMPIKFNVPAAQFPFIVHIKDLPDGIVFNENDGANWLDVDLSLRVADRREGAVVLLARILVVRVMQSPYEAFLTETTVRNDNRDAWMNLIPSTNIPVASTTLRIEEPISLLPHAGVPALRFSKPAESATTGTGIPRLRWSIKTSAPSSLDSQEPYLWGDTYFANSLRDALVRRGQIVAVDCLENKAKATGYLDDVVLNLQGYQGIVPVEGAVNISWVISHPELVLRDDLQHCQLVYAASHYWAELKSREWDLEVRSLLQCTDQYLFHPTGTDIVRSEAVVFVGNAVNRKRKLVEHAVALGIDVEIYGKGWHGRVPHRMIRAEHIENEALCDLYRSAKATLNDHWPDMREQGFLSNRAFDVVASGGRVVSDEVHGVPEEVLASMAVENDLRILLDIGREPVGSMAANRMSEPSPAGYVLAHHTFDARAQTLISDVMLDWRRL